MGLSKERITENSQSSWNGEERGSQENRIGWSYQPHPEPELLQVYGGRHQPTALLSMVIDGKQVYASLSRRRLFHLMSQCAGALSDMEPGK